MKKNLEEIIEGNLRALGDTEDDDPITTARLIVCPFFKSGGNNDCKGCIQAEETVSDCKDTYIERIKIRPMEVWSLEFDGIEVREKKVLDLTSTMGLRCDMCNISHACPEFKARATCSIDWSPQTNTNDDKTMINELIHLQQSRINFAKANELVDGGRPDQSLSTEMDRMSTLINARAELNTSKFSFQMSGKVSGDGTKKPGILSQIFGGAAGLASAETPSLNEGSPPLDISHNQITEAVVIDEKVKKPINLDTNKLEFEDDTRTYRQKKADKILAEKELADKNKSKKK